MSNEILEYIGLDIDNINKNLIIKKPKYNTSKAYDNSSLYRIYKMIEVKDIEILVSNTDRTTDIKERYEESKPLNEYINGNPKDFANLLKNSKISEIKEIEKLQKEFQEKMPYFIKYDKNYIWQIYYSKEDNKYFMLFPARDGDTSVLFYMIKQKLQDEKAKIYVPICKAGYEEFYFNEQEITDIENYIFLFTKEWPVIYEVERKCRSKETKSPSEYKEKVDTVKATDEENKLVYVVGKTKIKERFESKYRIEIKSKEDADNLYTLLKALFILTTESANQYSFEPVISKYGELKFEYKDKIIDIENLSDFISEEIDRQSKKENELLKKIDEFQKKLKKIKQEVDEQSEIYKLQEKQIVMFLDCKKSFFKRVRFFFKKTSADKKQTFSKKASDVETKQIDKSYSEKEVSDKIEQTLKRASIKAYTLSDLIRICKDVAKVEVQYKNAMADFKAMEIKKKNMQSKIKNAREYLDEIEKHKKSIFEFWRFTSKDEVPALREAESKLDENKLKVSFNYEEDMPELAVKADRMQKQKLSVDECNSIYACEYVLKSINSVLLGKNEDKVLKEELENLKKNYTGNKRTEIFGEIEEDYTKIKNLGNNKHRENRKNIYSILKVNERTTLEDYKTAIEDIVKLLNEAYKKITSVADFPVYYADNEEGKYIIGDIDPKSFWMGDNHAIGNKTSNSNTKEATDNKADVIYKMNITKDMHMIYLSNIIFYDNYNKTLPNGMDEGTKVIIKLDNERIGKTSNINIVEQKDLYNINVKSIKLIEINE